MYQWKGIDDTIAAVSTSMGQGGIGIVRISGREALPIADKMFRPNKGGNPSDFGAYTVHYGTVVDLRPSVGSGSSVAGEIIDEALLTVMRSPKSYTRDDVVEISCHGGMVSLKAILSLAVELGARLAEPGEFTQRAFLNGRIDLAQAEAVLDIIQSKTDAFLRVSNHQLKGDLSVELESIREKLMDVYVGIEAAVNFPEDETGPKGRDDIKRKVKKEQGRVGKLLESSGQGQILKEGIRVVICGRPNVGKSSLLNVFLKKPRAIVAEMPGTTRDTIEETVQVKGLPLQFVDTAGILKPRNPVEKESVKRSRSFISCADLVLLVLDASEKLKKQDEELMKHVSGGNVIVVFNKGDLALKIDKEKIKSKMPGKKIIKVSALKKTGIAKLEASIIENVWHGKTVDTSGILVSNLRHIEALRNCLSSLERSRRVLDDGLSLEFLSEEIKAAVNYLDNITGRNVDSDLLEAIFSQFCVGK